LPTTVLDLAEARRTRETRALCSAFRDAAVVLMPDTADPTEWVVGIGYGEAEREGSLEELLCAAIDWPDPEDDLAALRAILIRAVRRIDRAGIGSRGSL